MGTTATLLWIANLLIDTFGQLSFKAASYAPQAEGALDRWRIMLLSPWIWIGIGAYVVEFIVYLAFLTNVELSVAVLMGSLNIVAVMVGGKLFFKEQLTPNRMLATFLIAAGVAMVGMGGINTHK